MKTLHAVKEAFLDVENIPRPATGLSAICVFCGASNGDDPVLLRAATFLGEAIAHAGIRLIYGGGDAGLMGAVALAAARARGEVVAILPRFLASRMSMLPLPHEIVVVPDMHSRKKAMFERADAFVALPGGIGTIEELAEVITWQKLGQHRKPVLIANFQDFWRPLLDLFKHLIERGFMRGDVLEECLVVSEPSGILMALDRAAGTSAQHCSAHTSSPDGQSFALLMPNMEEHTAELAT